MPISMTFYNEVHPKLRKYIRYFWHTTGQVDKNTYQQLLPMDHVDLIIRSKGSFQYIIDNEAVKTENVSFVGIRQHSVDLVHDDYIESFGVSFEPWGFYPFINTSLSAFTNKAVNFSEVNPSLTLNLEELVHEKRSISDRINLIEDVLIKHLEVNKTYLESIEVIKDFIDINSEVDKVTVKEFCNERALQRRKLERNFNKYVGVSPKDFLRIRQFEDTSRFVMDESTTLLTEIAYEGEYYDQPHFAKTFKKYTAYTPSQFKKESPALKSKMTFK